MSPMLIWPVMIAHNFLQSHLVTLSKNWVCMIEIKSSSAKGNTVYMSSLTKGINLLGLPKAVPQPGLKQQIYIFYSSRSRRPRSRCCRFDFL